VTFLSEGLMVSVFDNLYKYKTVHPKQWVPQPGIPTERRNVEENRYV